MKNIKKSVEEKLRGNELMLGFFASTMLQKWFQQNYSFFIVEVFTIHIIWKTVKNEEKKEVKQLIVTRQPCLKWYLHWYSFFTNCFHSVVEMEISATIFPFKIWRIANFSFWFSFVMQAKFLSSSYLSLLKNKLYQNMIIWESDI